MFRYLEATEQWLAKVLLAACTLLVFIAAIARTFGYPIIWSVDIAQMLFAWTVFFGADQALRRNEHICVDLLVKHFPPTVRRALDIALWLLVSVFLGFLIWYGTELTLLNIERRFSDTPLSYGWVTASVPAGSALLLITSLRRLWRIARGEVIGTPSSLSESVS